MRAARMKVLGLVAVLVAGLATTATPAAATPAPATPARASTAQVSTAAVQASATRHRHRMAPGELRHYLRGKHLGPNRYTFGGVITITGWKYVGRNRAGRPMYSPKVKVTDGWAPRMTPFAAAGWWDDCWCNPVTWDWSDWFGSLWDHLVDCAKGAATVTFAQASGELVVKIAMQVAKKAVQTSGLQGYAVLAVGGCAYAAFSGGN